MRTRRLHWRGRKERIDLANAAVGLEFLVGLNPLLDIRSHHNVLLCARSAPGSEKSHPQNSIAPASPYAISRRFNR